MKLSSLLSAVLAAAVATIPVSAVTDRSLNVNNSTDAGGVGTYLDVFAGNNGVSFNHAPVWSNITGTFVVPTFSKGTGAGPWSVAIRVGIIVYWRTSQPGDVYSNFWTYAYGGVYAQVSEAGDVSTRFYYAAQEDVTPGGGYIETVPVSMGDQVTISLTANSGPQTTTITFQNIHTGQQTSTTVDTYIWLPISKSGMIWAASHLYWEMDSTFMDVTTDLYGIPSFTPFTMTNCSATADNYHADLTYSLPYSQLFGVIPATASQLSDSVVSFEYSS